ncbi:hypothetical protein L3X38_038731 [Prunus dulcis]|uniref:Uncharacterized protein n=1 Tax=Prunus dulcis TaxID=3755 RepID=A0AAD4V636_PRUDU|nr:hypothetical protein L3X38_038731 [Prunus dulcis]
MNFLTPPLHTNLSFAPIVMTLLILLTGASTSMASHLGTNAWKDVKPPNRSKRTSTANQTQSTPQPAEGGLKFTDEEC